MTRKSAWIFLTAFLSLSSATAFVAPGVCSRQAFSALHMAKKNRKGGSPTGKGFGKEPEVVESSPSQSSASTATESGSFLQSVDSGSKSIPTLEAPSKAKEPKGDPSLSPEERTKQILRNQYGLKSLEEQQTDAKKREKMAEERRKREEWKKMAEKEDLDLMQILPAPLLIGIDRFLKAGVAICTVLFVAAGIGITAEAWSAASGNPLPEDIDRFIVDVVEPNFTPGLLVLLGFSVSLGVFAALQLGSAGSQYREDK